MLINDKEIELTVVGVDGMPGSAHCVMYAEGIYHHKKHKEKDRYVRIIFTGEDAKELYWAAGGYFGTSIKTE